MFKKEKFKINFIYLCKIVLVRNYIDKYYKIISPLEYVNNKAIIISEITENFNKIKKLRPTQEALESIYYQKQKFKFIKYNYTKADNNIHQFYYIVTQLLNNFTIINENNINSLLDLDNANKNDFSLPQLVTESLNDFIKELDETIDSLITDYSYDQQGIALQNSNSDDNKESDSIEGEEISTSTSLSKENDHHNDVWTLVIDYFLSWIYELPKALQEKFLNSHPIKNLLEKINYLDYIYNFFSGFEKLTKIYEISSSEKPFTSSENKLKILIESNILVDTSLLYGSNLIGITILPIDAIPEVNLLGNI
ncbi:MAG: hypothetical protein AABY27_02975 [Pseudomonadota bacterium]